MAEESLQVIGLIRELLDLTQNDKPDEDVIKLSIEKVRQLRTVAANTKLVQAQEKELEDIDKLLNYLSKLRR
jgi:selenocysteine-specific translation elongation factor